MDLRTEYLTLFYQDILNKADIIETSEYKIDYRKNMWFPNIKYGKGKYCTNIIIENYKEDIKYQLSSVFEIDYYNNKLYNCIIRLARLDMCGYKKIFDFDVSELNVQFFMDLFTQADKKKLEKEMVKSDKEFSKFIEIFDDL